MKFSKDTFRSPIVIFIIYITVSCLLVYFYNQIFPAETSPLAVFEKSWKSNRSLLEVFSILPALLLSALVIPFGVLTEEQLYSRFSVDFFKRVKSSIALAFVSSLLYILLFFLALPIAQKHNTDMRFKSELYKTAKVQMQNNVNEKNWIEASQFLGICDSVWHNSPELAVMRNEIEINLASSNYYRRETPLINPVSVTALPGYGEPVDANEAIVLSETAFAEGKYLDAHWFAALGERIARNGSPEKTRAARLAVLAWNEIEKLEPTDRETAAFSFHRQKMIGYEAMISGDWIRAFYHFQELQGLSPGDPDIANFLETSEKKTRETAFFLNEMEINPGQSFSGTLFSLPGDFYGRMVMRVSSLNYSPDFAYGIGIEYMVFDDQANLVLSMEAPYAKFTPFTMNENRQVLVLMRALDFHDLENRWEPRWFGPDGTEVQGQAQIVLDISYETFVMLSRLRQGISGMYFNELFTASNIAETAGYIPQVFQAEIINQLGSSLFFLPLAIFTISIAWSLRTMRRSRFVFFLMLPVLPLVFLSLIKMYQNILNTIGISLVLTFSFSIALTFLIVFLAVSLLGSLIFLASRKS